MEKNSKGMKCLEIDPEGDQGPTWTMEPVESAELLYRVK